jgi:hypothetical protein
MLSLYCQNTDPQSQRMTRKCRRVSHRPGGTLTPQIPIFRLSAPVCWGSPLALLSKTDQPLFFRPDLLLETVTESRVQKRFNIFGAAGPSWCVRRCINTCARRGQHLARGPSSDGETGSANGGRRKFRGRFHSAQQDAVLSIRSLTPGVVGRPYKGRLNHQRRAGPLCSKDRFCEKNGRIFCSNCGTTWLP